jgi:hypothetical protein
MNCQVKDLHGLVLEANKLEIKSNNAVSVAIEWLRFLLRIPEVWVSNLGLGAGHPD